MVGEKLGMKEAYMSCQIDYSPPVLREKRDSNTSLRIKSPLAFSSYYTLLFLLKLILVKCLL